MRCTSGIHMRALDALRACASCARMLFGWSVRTFSSGRTSTSSCSMGRKKPMRLDLLYAAIAVTCVQGGAGRGMR